MGNLYLVTTPIGNLSEMSENAIRTLKEVDYIACEDTRTSMTLLHHFDIKNKLVSYHKFNEEIKSNNIIDNLLIGNDIALISDAGVPSISDPGYILVKKCIENGINVFAIGINCALINALIISGFNTSNFMFLGFLPRENSDLKKVLTNIKNNQEKVVIIYESPKRIIKTLEKIKEILANPNVCVCNDLTKKFEKKYYGTTEEVISQLLANANHELGEYVVVIEKNDDVVEDDLESVSVEARLIDIVVKEKCSLKDAIAKLNSINDNLSKKDIYNASLNLKNILNVN